MAGGPLSGITGCSVAVYPVAGGWWQGCTRGGYTPVPSGTSSSGLGTSGTGPRLGYGLDSDQIRSSSRLCLDSDLIYISRRLK